MANSSRGRGESSTVLWAVVAVLVIGAFVAWLALTAEPSVPPPPPEEPAADTTVVADTAAAAAADSGQSSQ